MRLLSKSLPCLAAVLFTAALSALAHAAPVQSLPSPFLYDDVDLWSAPVEDHNVASTFEPAQGIEIHNLADPEYGNALLDKIKTAQTSSSASESEIDPYELAAIDAGLGQQNESAEQKDADEHEAGKPAPAVGMMEYPHEQSSELITSAVNPGTVLLPVNTQKAQKPIQSEAAGGKSAAVPLVQSTADLPEKAAEPLVQIFAGQHFKIMSPQSLNFMAEDVQALAQEYAQAATSMLTVKEMADDLEGQLSKLGYGKVSFAISSGKGSDQFMVLLKADRSGGSTYNANRLRPDDLGDLPEVDNLKVKPEEPSRVLTALQNARSAAEEEELKEFLSSYGQAAGTTIQGAVEAEDKETYLMQTAKSRAESYVNAAMNAYLENLGMNSQLSVTYNYDGELQPFGKLLIPFINTAHYTAYFQTGLTAAANERQIYHAALGLRWYPYAESIKQAGDLMLGLNTVWDYERERGHQGYSIGAEVMTNRFLLSANYYGRLTNWKQSSVYGDEYEEYIQERFAAGADLRGKFFVPGFDNLAVTGAIEHWFGDKIAPFGASAFDDLEDDPWVYSGGLEWQPVPAITLSAQHQQSALRQTNDQITLSFNLPLGYELKDAFNPHAVNANSGMDVSSSRSMFIDRRYDRPFQYRATPDRYIITYVGPLGDDRHQVNVSDVWGNPAPDLTVSVKPKDDCVELDHKDGTYITDDAGNIIFEVVSSCVDHTEITVSTGEDEITFPIVIDKIDFDISAEPEEIQRHESSEITLDGGDGASDIEVEWDLKGPGKLRDEERYTDSRGQAHVTYVPDYTRSESYKVTITAEAQGNEFEVTVRVMVYGNEPGDLYADPIEIDAGDQAVITYRNLRPGSIAYFKAAGAAKLTVPPEFTPTAEDYPEVDDDEKPLRPEDYPDIVWGDGSDDVDPVDAPEGWGSENPGSAHISSGGDHPWHPGVENAGDNVTDLMGTSGYVDALVNDDGIAKVIMESQAAVLYKDQSGNTAQPIYDEKGNVSGMSVITETKTDDGRTKYNVSNTNFTKNEDGTYDLSGLDQFTAYSPDAGIPDRDDQTEPDEVSAVQVSAQTEDPYFMQYAPSVLINIHNYYAQWILPEKVEYGDEFEAGLKYLKPGSTVRFDDSEAHGLTRDGRRYTIRLVSAPLQQANSEGEAYAVFKVSREYYDQENGLYYDKTYYPDDYMGYDKVSGIKAYYYRNYKFQEHEIRADAFTADANIDGSGDGIEIVQHQIYFDLGEKCDAKQKNGKTLLAALEEFSGDDEVTLCLAGGYVSNDGKPHEVEWTVENAVVIEQDDGFDKDGYAYITIKGSNADSGIINVKSKAMGNLDDLNRTLRDPSAEENGGQDDVEWHGPIDGLTYKTWEPVIDDIQNTHIVKSYSMEKNVFDVRTPQLFTLSSAKPYSGVVWSFEVKREGGHAEEAAVHWQETQSEQAMSEAVLNISYDAQDKKIAQTTQMLDSIEGFDVLEVTVNALYYRKSTEQRTISKTFKVYDYDLTAEADRTSLDAYVYQNKQKVYDYTTVTISGGRPGEAVKATADNALINTGFDDDPSTPAEFNGVFDADGNAYVEVMSKSNYQGQLSVDAEGVGDSLHRDGGEVVLPYQLKEYTPQLDDYPTFTYYDGTAHERTIDYRTDYPLTISGLMPGSPVQLYVYNGDPADNGNLIDNIASSGEPEGKSVFWASEGENGGQVSFTLSQIIPDDNDFAVEEANIKIYYLKKGSDDDQHLRSAQMAEGNKSEHFDLDVYDYELDIAVNKPQLSAGGFRDGKRFPDREIITLSNGRAGEKVIWEQDDKADTHFDLVQADETFDENGNAYLIYDSRQPYEGKEGLSYVTSAHGVGDDSDEISFKHHFLTTTMQSQLPYCSYQSGLCVENSKVSDNGLIDYRTNYQLQLDGLIPGSPVKITADKTTVNGDNEIELNAPNDPTDDDGTASITFDRLLLDAVGEPGDYDDTSCFSTKAIKLKIEYYTSAGSDQRTAATRTLNLYQYKLQASISKTRIEANKYVNGKRQEDSTKITVLGGRQYEKAIWDQDDKAADLKVASIDQYFDVSGAAELVYESLAPFTNKDGRDYVTKLTGAGGTSNPVTFEYYFVKASPQSYLPYCSYSNGLCSGTSVSSRTAGRIDYQTAYNKTYVAGLVPGTPVQLTSNSSYVKVSAASTVPTTGIDSNGRVSLPFTINSVTNYSASSATFTLKYYKSTADQSMSSYTFTVSLYQYNLSLSGVPESIVGSECFTATVSGGRSGSDVSWTISGSGEINSKTTKFDSAGKATAKVCGISPYSSTIKINVKAIVQSIVKQANIIIVNHIDLSIVINDDYKCNGLKIGDQFEEFGPYYIKDWQDVYQVNIVGSVSADDASAAVIDGTRFNFGDWSRKVNITSAITLSSANITILAEAINKECCKCNFKGTLSISFDIK